MALRHEKAKLKRIVRRAKVDAVKHFDKLCRMGIHHQGWWRTYLQWVLPLNGKYPGLLAADDWLICTYYSFWTKRRPDSLYYAYQHGTLAEWVEKNREYIDRWNERWGHPFLD